MIFVLSSLNKLDAATKGTKRFSNPQALSSTLAALETLQPQAFGLLNRLVPLVLASNMYSNMRMHMYELACISKNSYHFEILIQSEKIRLTQVLTVSA